MCSWCYGFSNEFSETVSELGEEIDLQLVMGGLRPYNTETMTDLKSFLTDHWKEVNHRSGQVFQYGILDNNSIVYDTEPSCRAVVAFRSLKPDETLSFFKDIQRSFYAENKHPLKAETYANIAMHYGIEKQVFINLMESDKMKAEVKQDFTLAQSMNARSFPTVLLKNEGQYYLVSQGYTTKDVLLARIQKVLSE